MLRSLSRCSALILTTGFALLTSAAGAVTFDDGQLHVIDAANSFPLEDVDIFDGPFGAQTTVELIEGGAVGTISGALRSFDSSRLIMSGGMSRGIWISDSSHGTISGGIVNASVTIDQDRADIRWGVCG
jgi:hypothetical protein